MALETAAMREFFGYLVIGLLAVAAMGLSTVAGLDIAVGARPMPEGGPVIQHVDRTHKGDRLDMRGSVGTRPMTKKEIFAPDGCEPMFSPLVAPDQPKSSGRCIS